MYRVPPASLNLIRLLQCGPGGCACPNPQSASSPWQTLELHRHIPHTHTPKCAPRRVCMPQSAVGILAAAPECGLIACASCLESGR